MLAPSFGGTETEAAADDFARGDNSHSLAVHVRLEFHVEVGLNELSCGCLRVITKYEVILLWLTERGRKIRVYLLLVCFFRSEYGLTCPFFEKGSVLLLVQQKKLNVGIPFVSRGSSLLKKRLIGAFEARSSRVRRHFERNLHCGADTECTLQDWHRSADDGVANEVGWMRLYGSRLQRFDVRFRFEALHRTSALLVLHVGSQRTDKFYVRIARWIIGTGARRFLGSRCLRRNSRRDQRCMAHMIPRIRRP